jgi:opacity protein-like surface antigen
LDDGAPRRARRRRGKVEAMVSVRFFVGAAAAAMLSTAASAADMPAPPPPPQPVYQPMPVVLEQPAGAWYLRGFIGVGITDNLDFVYQQNPLNSSNFSISHAAMADTVFFGAGVGYEFNNWLRFDVTGEYRTKSAINAFGTYTQPVGGGGIGTFGDQYLAFLKSTVFLANAYVDLGTWNCVTPFVGFGIGGAWNTFDDLVDLGIGTSGNGIGTNASELNFAWALHAGLAYNVTQNFTMELAYRYLNYGSVTDKIYCQGGCNPDSYKLQNLTSQDFMLGFRWRFPIEAAAPLVVAAQPAYGVIHTAPPPPVYTQAAPVYQPPPVYTQPPVYQPPPPQYPLSTRG